MRRWDILIRVASGPTASPDLLALRGPDVVVGRDPGPRGLALPLGRGVAARHCTLTAYAPDAAEITPNGDHPVRLAPFPDVDWDALEPVRGRVKLARGTAIHLGPTAERGVTLVFEGCRDLGDASSEGIASEVAPESIVAVRQVPSVRTLLAERGGLFVAGAGLSAAAAVLFLLAGVLLVIGGSVPSEQPEDEAWKYVWVTDADLELDALSKHAGFQGALDDFLYAPDRALAKAAGEEAVPGLDPRDPDTWDPRFSAAVVKATRKFAQRWIFRRFDDVAEDFHAVIAALEASQRPLVLAGIPMLESCYNPRAVSEVCAYGWWQFMPEFGARFRSKGPEYDVDGCRFLDGRPGRFTPSRKAPPGFVRLHADYIDRDGGRCALQLPCGADFRDDLGPATEVAILALGEVLDDQDVARSGAAVQIAIASHHAGWDDAALLGTAHGKQWNLKRSYRAWHDQRGRKTPTAHFYGDVSRCSGVEQTEAGCSHFMAPLTQTYAPAAIAEFLLAVCYYGKNTEDFPWASKWSRYHEPGGFCTDLPISVPTRAEVSRVRFDPNVRWCRRSP